MSPFIRLLVSTLMLISVTACGGLTSSDDPELNSLEIIDTGGSDSAVVGESNLLIDADENTTSTDDGEFTLYWDVVSDDDYTFDLYINDDDRINDALTIYSGVCDEDDDCNEDQMLDCIFQDDLNLVCDDFNGDDVASVDLGFFTDDFPEDLVFILQVCDPFGFDCEDRSIEARFDD
ncbi:MAG: hypothetical protein AAFZ92_01425 [Pseudomonadota bacterium]